MIDLDLLRSAPDLVREGITAKRLGDPDAVDRALAADTARRAAVTKAQELRQAQGEVSAQIGPLMKAGKREEAAPLVEQSNTFKAQIKDLDAEIRVAEATLRDALLAIPNPPHASVPVGGEDANELVFEWGDKPAFDFEALPHWDLADTHGLIDFERGSKVTGAGFPFYVGKGARLQRGLIQLFLDLATDAGYTEIQPPLLFNEDSGIGTGQLPDKEGQMYRVPMNETDVSSELDRGMSVIFDFSKSAEDRLFFNKESADEMRELGLNSIEYYETKLDEVRNSVIGRLSDFYLVPTSEVALVNYRRDEILDEGNLPLRYTAYTPCFRREAGSYGKDVRGLNRLHQFDKVEVVEFCRPEDSYDRLEALREVAERAVQTLGLPYRRLVLATGDLGMTQTKTYDLEVWSAGQERWLEVSSISNIEAYQARRANIRYRPEGGKPQFVHTLNASALALPRIVAALLEQGQMEDRSIRLPTPLAERTGFDRID
ncbi:MAG: serine--tRNA ligase [Rubricoccaceae bacterium]